MVLAAVGIAEVGFEQPEIHADKRRKTEALMLELVLGADLGLAVSNEAMDLSNG